MALRDFNFFQKSQIGFLMHVGTDCAGQLRVERDIPTKNCTIYGNRVPTVGSLSVYFSDFRCIVIDIGVFQYTKIFKARSWSSLSDKSSTNLLMCHQAATPLQCWCPQISLRASNIPLVWTSKSQSKPLAVPHTGSCENSVACTIFHTTLQGPV